MRASTLLVSVFAATAASQGITLTPSTICRGTTCTRPPPDDPFMTVTETVTRTVAAPTVTSFSTVTSVKSVTATYVQTVTTTATTTRTTTAACAPPKVCPTLTSTELWVQRAGDNDHELPL
ncbi:hypothetical protein DL546_003898 [Coniochaeta pulveracea]|uniref:Uncharacterized protein n=1 Tax=Coniochaeta pulveracea TaxID=177199 RepID=A0A420YB78_9PEZI|nr:hypothetical protein DL546_003898 [Coniochaeta pulveracea]